MLQELSWINIISSAEQKSVMFANFNKNNNEISVYGIFTLYRICSLKQFIKTLIPTLY